jgi:hypothetical protein
MGQTQGQPLLATPSPTLVQGLVPDDPKQPGPECSLFTKARQSPMGLDECLLDHVLGHAAIPHDQIGHPEGDLLM